MIKPKYILVCFFSCLTTIVTAEEEIAFVEQQELVPEEMVIADAKAKAYCDHSEFSKAYILNKINQKRLAGMQCGGKTLAPVGQVTWNDKLAVAAKVHANDMAANRFLDHKGSDGSYPEKRVDTAGYDWAFITENVASGTHSVADTLKSFMESEYHCENLMSPDVKEVGMACAYTPEDFQKFYWTQVFAK